MSTVATPLSPAQQVALATLSRQGYLGPSTTRLSTVRVLARLGLVTLTGTAGDWIAYPADVWHTDDEQPDREPTAEQERAWDEQYDGTSLGA